MSPNEGNGSTAASEELLASVVINQPLPILDYRVPETLAATVCKGLPVLVPLRKRRTSAYVVAVRRARPPADMRLRDIEGVDDERPALSSAVIDLVLFAAGYYAVSEGEMLSAALPALARPATVLYVLTDLGRQVGTQSDFEDRQKAILELVSTSARGITVAAVERRLGCSRRVAGVLLRRAVDRGLLARRQARPGRRMQAYVERTSCESDAELARRPALHELLTRLPPHGQRIAVAELVGSAPAVSRKLKALEQLGYVSRCRVAQVTNPVANNSVGLSSSSAVPTPTSAQAIAIEKLREAIDANEFASYLLEGVTGSGKTEVYLRAIAHALASGKSALVLVPEIALTPQLGEIFVNRFGPQVAIFHSGLTVAERRDEWERVAAGEARIGLGARSALFLPLLRLGLLVVDEEHETTFKQEESPRYNARDLAIVRAQREGAVVVLGSATPSFESRVNAENGRYRHLLLPERVCDRALPPVERVNLAQAERVGSGMLTERLARALESTLASGEQAILYLNRRGFAPYVFCQDCGHAYRCVDCAVALTWHRRRDALVCHHCGYEEVLPDECSQCHGHRVTASGAGVEKLESDLVELFGHVEIARLDRDSVRTRQQLVTQLTRFRSGEAKILLGTQMVTKGHDFPGVTLVGVVSADASLNFPDFRAAERTFQLLTQVSGRAGRGTRAGIVIVQAYEVDHYAVETASRHDYAGFIEKERTVRRELGYPPYMHLALLRIEGADENETMTEATRAAEQMRLRARHTDGKVRVLGPASAPIPRLRGLWRVQVLVKGVDRVLLRRVLLPLSEAHNVRQVLDVDPYSML